jgi:hypothetical protein
MRPDSITAAERGTPLRITTLIETEQNAASDSVDWAPAWVNVEDRAYALLGVVQGMLETSVVRLGYIAIQIH